MSEISSTTRVNREFNALQITPEQHKVLDRILTQRERVHARQLALTQARALKESKADRVEPDAPFAIRLLTFARLHPVAVAAVLGLTLIAGPTKLIRVAGVVLPIVMRMRR